MRSLVIILVLGLISGCGTIRDYDPEKAEIEQAHRYGQPLPHEEPTANSVVVGEKKNVTVLVEKAATVENEGDIDQETWNVFVINFNPKPKCVMLVWKLMDFRYISNEPANFLARPGQTRVGTMLQQIWQLNGLRFAPPGSGLLHLIETTEPDLKAKRGDECSLIDKKGIVEKK